MWNLRPPRLTQQVGRERRLCTVNKDRLVCQREAVTSCSLSMWDTMHPSSARLEKRAEANKINPGWVA